MKNHNNSLSSQRTEHAISKQNDDTVKHGSPKKINEKPATFKPYQNIFKNTKSPEGLSNVGLLDSIATKETKNVPNYGTLSNHQLSRRQNLRSLEVKVREFRESLDLK